VIIPEALTTTRCELLIAGLPREVEASSVRVHATGGRRINATRARLVVPDQAPRPAASKSERSDLARTRRELELKLASNDVSRRLLSDASSFASGPSDRRLSRDLVGSVREGLAVIRLFDELAGEAETQRQALVAQLTTIDARLVALDLADEAASRDDDLEARLEVRIELAAGDGPPGLTIEYVVSSARYWPAYTARFSERGTKAVLCFEPFVMQTSGEDWTDVRVSIATGDLVTDGTLPKLPSLRYGRAQVVKRPGYRPLPADSARLFEGFDVAWKRGRAELPSALAPLPTPMSGSLGGDVGPGAAFSPAPYGAASPALAEDIEADEPLLASAGGPPPGAMAFVPPQEMPMPRGKGLFAFGGSAPAAPARASAAEVQKKRAASSPSRDESSLTTTASLRPADGLLDFDGLVLPPPQSPDRGRLVPATAPAGRNPRRAEFEAVPPPPGARDPDVAGALFDHVFHGTTTCRVPSSPRPVRITVDRRAARSTPRLTAVPRESNEVFREADVDNPFDGPLLPGPIDVLLDGTLVSEAALPLVIRGTKARIGMGVEDRVKLARNARVEEKTTGLLGGQRTIDHAITIDAVSALPFTAYLEIRERIPTTAEDSGVEIKLVAATPTPSLRDLDGAGTKLRGGLIWQLELPAGAATKVSFHYRVSLSAKDEVAGGNRRE
jgi:hypothetical protein